MQRIIKERGYIRHLTCSERTYQRIMTECVLEYLKHHPEMQGIPITSGKILDEISKIYMKV